MVQILDDAVLADDLLNLALGLDVEGVVVEQVDLLLAFSLGLLFAALLHGEDLSPADGVVEGGEEFGFPLA